MSGDIRAHLFGPDDGVPASVAPFGQATLCDGRLYDGRLYVTGQMPIDPATNEVVPGGIEAQTDQVMRNLTRVVEPCGSRLDRAVQARAYLMEFERDYAAFNAAYRPMVSRPASQPDVHRGDRAGRRRARRGRSRRRAVSASSALRR